MDGVELMMRVLAELERPDMAVIVISGNGTLERAVEAMRLGASDYVAKPYNMDDLLLRVERAIERREMILEHQTTILELQALLQHQGSEIGSAMGEMMQAYNGTLEALAAALDLRDKETGGSFAARHRLFHRHCPHLGLAWRGARRHSARGVIARCWQDRHSRFDLAQTVGAQLGRVAFDAPPPGDRGATFARD